MLTPTHQSLFVTPTPLAQRQEIIQWATEKKRWIIEDDYDGEFHYEKQLIPALKSHDVGDRVIYMGSFSKTILPSMRISYLVVPAALQPKLVEITNHRSPLPLLNQKIAARFLCEGHFAKHLRKMRALYIERREFAISAIEKVFPGKFKIERTAGGLLIPAFFVRKVDDTKIAAEWNRKGVAVKPISAWYSGKKKASGLVFGFTNVRSEDEAVRVLRTLMDSI